MYPVKNYVLEKAGINALIVTYVVPPHVASVVREEHDVSKAHNIAILFFVLWVDGLHPQCFPPQTTDQIFTTNVARKTRT